MIDGTHIRSEDSHAEGTDDFDFVFRTLPRHPTQVLVVWKAEPLFVITLASDNPHANPSTSTEISKQGKSSQNCNELSHEEVFFKYSLTEEDIDHILDRIRVMTGVTFKSERGLFSETIGENPDRDYYVRKILKRFNEYLREQRRAS